MTSHISNYNRANDVAVCVCGNRLLERLMSPSPKSQVMRPYSHESVIFSYFWHSYFLRYGHFVEYACMQLTVVVGADWTLHHGARPREG